VDAKLMDAIVVKKKLKPFLPPLAAVLKEWFPEVGPRSVAVSEVDINKQNVPTLPLVMTAFLRSTANPPTNGRNDQFRITDAFCIEFWLKPIRYKNDKGETPFWSYYPYEDIRDTLLTNLARWEAPNNERIVYRGLSVEAEEIAITLTFQFTATYDWCAEPNYFGDPFQIGFNLCTPVPCDPTAFCEEPDPCRDDVVLPTDHPYKNAPP
jgi:hypothetical protein